MLQLVGSLEVITTLLLIKRKRDRGKMKERVRGLDEQKSVGGYYRCMKLQRDGAKSATHCGQLFNLA